MSNMDDFNLEQNLILVLQLIKVSFKESPFFKVLINQINTLALSLTFWSLLILTLNPYM